MLLTNRLESVGTADIGVEVVETSRVLPVDGEAED
jgi:hypothetical protein